MFIIFLGIHNILGFHNIFGYSQDEIKDLKEQVQMMESASNLGINGHSSTSTGFVDQNDSLIDLGIKKTLDYDTPQGTPTVLRSQ